MAPIAAGRYALQFSIGQSAHDKLRHAQELLSHSIPSGDLAQVFERALDVLITQLEKRKFAATKKPGPSRPTTNRRTIPAHVRRAVWERDGGRCTFVAENGHRCESRKFLEFDHVTPVARGGQATVEGMRLRCRAHNQYEAERALGAGFMDAKREEARRAAAQARAERDEAQARASAEADRARASEAAQQQMRDVTAGLRNLGFRAEQARRAAELCSTLPDTTLEGRVRAALAFLCPKTRFHGPIGTSQAAPAGPA